MDRLPPVELGPAGRRLWLAMWERASVPGHLHEIALQACKQADRASECREILRSATVLAEDRFGQQKTHPAVEIERKASLACASLVKQVCGEVDAEITEAIEEDFFS
jgi:hypothetical protein